MKPEIKQIVLQEVIFPISLIIFVSCISVILFTSCTSTLVVKNCERVVNNIYKCESVE